MEHTFEECKDDLLKSNTLWQECIKAKEVANVKQRLAAEAIKNIYEKFHARIEAKFGVQGQVRTILSDEGDEIIGLEVEYKAMNGQEKHRFMLNSPGEKPADHASAGSSETSSYKKKPSVSQDA